MEKAPSKDKSPVLVDEHTAKPGADTKVQEKGSERDPDDSRHGPVFPCRDLGLPQEQLQEGHTAAVGLTGGGPPVLFLQHFHHPGLKVHPRAALDVHVLVQARAKDHECRHEEVDGHKEALE